MSRISTVIRRCRPASMLFASMVTSLSVMSRILAHWPFWSSTTLSTSRPPCLHSPPRCLEAAQQARIQGAACAHLGRPRPTRRLDDTELADPMQPVLDGPCLRATHNAGRRLPVSCRPRLRMSASCIMHGLMDNTGATGGAPGVGVEWRVRCAVVDVLAADYLSSRRALPATLHATPAPWRTECSTSNTRPPAALRHGQTDAHEPQPRAIPETWLLEQLSAQPAPQPTRSGRLIKHSPAAPPTLARAGSPVLHQTGAAAEPNAVPRPNA